MYQSKQIVNNIKNNLKNNLELLKEQSLMSLAKRSDSFFYDIGKLPSQKIFNKMS